MTIPPVQIPAGLAAAYGVSQNDLRFITQVQNYIFAYERDGEEYILRLTPQTHQNPQQVMAEVDWVNDLAARGGLTVFDFDSCEYNWFVADLGTVVFEAATCGYQKLPRDEFIKGFLDRFIDGYEREYPLGAAVNQVPLFAKLREICIYLVLRKRWKNRMLSEFQHRFFESVRVGVVEARAFYGEGARS